MIKNSFLTFSIRIILRAIFIVAWCCILWVTVSFITTKVTAWYKNTLVVFAWGDVFHPDVIKQFERETGIKVHITSFASNEELLLKMAATQGRGYDIVVPSDYAAGILRQQQLLKELDKKQFSWWSELVPFLLNHDFDPDNNYTVPYEWEIFGFGVDRSVFNDMAPTWCSVFKSISSLIMVNDPLEAIWIAAACLGYNEVNTQQKWHNITQLLLEQKPHVAAYTDNRGDYYLVTKNSPLVVASSSYIWRSMKDSPHVSFIIPQSSLFLTIENLAITAASTKETLAYQFINFLMRPDIQKYHAQEYAFLPTLQTVLPEYADKYDVDDLITQLQQNKIHYSFFTPLPAQEVMRIWIKVKTS